MSNPDDHPALALTGQDSLVGPSLEANVLDRYHPPFAPQTFGPALCSV